VANNSRAAHNYRTALCSSLPVGASVQPVRGATIAVIAASLSELYQAGVKP